MMKIIPVVAMLILSSSGLAQIPNANVMNTPSMDGPQYIYDPTGKKDPFKPFRAPRIRGDNRPSAPVDPLMQVEVTSLQLVAVMWNTARPRAVVKDPTGKIFTIFKNNKVGRNEGVVVDIREGEVVIVEKFDDGLGNIVREPRVLEMKVRSDGDAMAAGG